VEDLGRQWALPCHIITRFRSFLFRVSDVEILVVFTLQSGRDDSKNVLPSAVLKMK
jgi:hypothetical protein